MGFPCFYTHEYIYCNISDKIYQQLRLYFFAILLKIRLCKIYTGFYFIFKQFAFAAFCPKIFFICNQLPQQFLYNEKEGRIISHPSIFHLLVFVLCNNSIAIKIYISANRFIRIIICRNCCDNFYKLMLCVPFNAAVKRICYIAQLKIVIAVNIIASCFYRYSVIG